MFIFGSKYNDNVQLQNLPPNDPKLVAINEKNKSDDIMGRVVGEHIGDDDLDYLVLDGKPIIGSDIKDQYKALYEEIINDIAKALIASSKPK